MTSAMNALGYDAATIGNHDFDFGLETLRRMLGHAEFPVVMANAWRPDGAPFLPERTILDRSVICADGGIRDLRIGITGTVPPQVARWNAPVLEGALSFGDTVTAARTQAARLREEGADLVVVLCHGGLGAAPDEGPGGKGHEMAENTALAIAALPCVDAVVAGHTHAVHPAACSDMCNCAVEGTPVVQPGSLGSHLGCIDLALERDEAAGRWTLLHACARTLAAGSGAPQVTGGLRRILRAQPALRRDLAEGHRTTRRFTERQIGETLVPLHTYFSYLAPCAATQLVADAQRAAAERAIARTGLSGMRLLSATSPFRAGMGKYTDIPAGPLRLRHMHDLYCYDNLLSVLRVRGADLRDWLERAASIYRRIDPGDPAPQLLLDPDFAGYNFDRLDGLSYDIDVSRPARTNGVGDRIFEEGGRIGNLRYGADGPAVADEDEVLVVASS
jgi:2',3'-cyclic-nucleotide 2'-phosphodiesterase/3'-nucleotidase